MTPEQLKAELAQITKENQMLREGLEFAHEAAVMTYDNTKKQAFFDKYRKKYAKNGCFSQQIIIDTLGNALQTPPTPGLGAAMLRVVEAAKELRRLRFESGFWAKVMTTPLQAMDADLQQKNITVGKAFGELDDSVQDLKKLESK